MRGRERRRRWAAQPYGVAAAVVLLGVVGAASAGGPAPRAVVVMNAFMMPSEIAAPNAAILVTDRRQVERIHRLFQGNRRVQHACGYHYELQIWPGPNRPLEIVPWNVECEEFDRDDGEVHRTMASFVGRLESRPTHWVYDVSVPIAVEPEDAVRQLERAGHAVFAMNGDAGRYPAITFRYALEAVHADLDDRSGWDVEEAANERKVAEAMEAIARQVEREVTVRRKTAPEFVGGAFSGRFSQELEMTLYLEPGANPARAQALVEARGAKIQSVARPEKYELQVVEPTSDLATVRARLAPLPCVSNVRPYGA